MAKADPTTVFKATVCLATLLAIAFLSQSLGPAYRTDGPMAAALMVLIASAVVGFISLIGFLFLQLSEETERLQRLRQQQADQKKQ